MNSAENEKPSEIKIVTVTFVHEEEQIDFPEDDVKPTFQSLEEWLYYLCDHENPSNKIDSYSFMISQAGHDFIIAMAGVNNYEAEENYTISRNEFEPGEMFYLVPGRECDGLDIFDVIEKTKLQFVSFLATEKFKTSFLVKANSIKVNGAEVWVKG